MVLHLTAAVMHILPPRPWVPKGIRVEIKSHDLWRERHEEHTNVVLSANEEKVQLSKIRLRIVPHREGS